MKISCEKIKNEKTGKRVHGYNSNLHKLTICNLLILFLSTGFYLFLSKSLVTCIHWLKMTRFVLLFLWMTQHLSVLQGEIFTSLSQLKGLARLEAALSLSLDNYLKDQPQPPEILRNFADNVRRESEIARGDIENYVFHPINSFQLVRRFVRHWKELDSYLSKGTRNGK